MTELHGITTIIVWDFIMTRCAEGGGGGGVLWIFI